LQVFEHPVQPLELFFEPEPEAFEPLIQFLKWLSSQCVNPALRVGTHFHQTGISQRAKMLGRLRLPDAKPFSNRTHRKRFAEQEIDDLQAAGFGECPESLDHRG
jgi:hypothetical protein